MATLISPYQYFADPQKARPVFNGFIYIGKPDGDPTKPDDQIQISVICECGGTPVNVTQPIRTGPGGIPIYNGSPAQINVPAAEFSITLQDKDRIQVYYSPRVTGFNDFSAENAVTHATRMDAISDSNANRLFIKLGELNGASYRRAVDVTEYNKFPDVMRFTDSGSHLWVLMTEGILDLSHVYSQIPSDIGGVITLSNSMMWPVLFSGGTYITTVTPTTEISTFDNSSLTIGDVTYEISKSFQRIDSFEQTEPDGVKVRLNNYSDGVDSSIALTTDDSTYANTSIGTSALQRLETGIRNTAIGPFTLSYLTSGFSNTAIGTNACEWMGFGNRNTFLGDNSGKNHGNSSPVTRHEYFRSTNENPQDYNTKWPEWREYAGNVDSPNFIATSQNDANRCVGIGRNALGFSITSKSCVGVGYDASTSLLNGNNTTMIGDRVGQLTLQSDNSFYGGGQSAIALVRGGQDTFLGAFSGARMNFSSRNTAIGYQSMWGNNQAVSDEPTENVSVGRIALANASGSFSENTAIGNSALSGGNTGNCNTALGRNALLRLTTGSNNTALGKDSLILMSDGIMNLTSATNCTGIGYQSRISGNNQVQLGNSTTTSYAFGALQDRSDKRDKIDIKNIPDEFIDFILSVEWKQFRFNYRDNYSNIDEKGNIKTIDNDGSKAGNRYHNGVIAQDVKKLSDDLNIDFAGYQDHSINGGSDIKTIGYQEFIPIIGELCKRQQKQIDILTEKVNILESS